MEDIVTPQLKEEATGIENNPKMMLALIDLLFMGMDEGKNIPS